MFIRKTTTKGSQKLSFLAHRKSILLEDVIENTMWPLARKIVKPLCPELYTWDDVNVILIVSTGRTGTKFFADLFAQAFRGVEAKHEPFPDMFDLAMSYLRTNMSLQEAVENFKQHRERICAKVHKKNCRIYVESNNHLSWLLPVVLKCFKNCRIIHVVRDGREYVRSQYSKKTWSSKKDGSMAFFMGDDDCRKRPCAQDFPDDAYNSQWDQMTRFEKTCWYWTKTNRVIYETIKDDDRAITIKFEDIFNSSRGSDAMFELIETLGMADMNRLTKDEIKTTMNCKSNATKDNLISGWQDWPEEQIESFRRIASEDMKLYGYTI